MPGGTTGTAGVTPGRPRRPGVGFTDGGVGLTGPLPGRVAGAGCGSPPTGRRSGGDAGRAVVPAWHPASSAINTIPVPARRKPGRRLRPSPPDNNASMDPTLTPRLSVTNRYAEYENVSRNT
jgi:hypothetical protein